MSPTGIKIKFNDANMRKLQKAGPAVMRAFMEVMKREAIDFSAVSMDGAAGTNRRSIQTDRKGDVWRIFTVSGYGGLLELGTGLFGPKGQRIKPKKGRFLVWETDEGIFFATSTAGMRPQPFMRPAFDLTKSRAKEIISNVARDIETKAILKVEVED